MECHFQSYSGLRLAVDGVVRTEDAGSLCASQLTPVRGYSRQNSHKNTRSEVFLWILLRRCASFLRAGSARGDNAVWMSPQVMPLPGGDLDSLPTELTSRPRLDRATLRGRPKEER